MKFAISFLLVSISFCPTLVSSATIDSICGGIKGIYDCKATFDIPTTAVAKMCPNKFFEVLNRYPSEESLLNRKID